MGAACSFYMGHENAKRHVVLVVGSIIGSGGKHKEFFSVN